MDLSICISYYDGLDYLLGCLASIRAGGPRCDHEVIVVDDAAPRPCGAAVAERFPGVRVVRNAVNQGFAGASNVAMEAAQGRFLLLLNSDTEVSGGALDELVAHLEAHEGVGAVGPKVLNADGTLQPQCRRGRLTATAAIAYLTTIDRIFPDSRVLGEYVLRYEDPDRRHEVRALSGACMMVRRSVIEEIGGFDESLVQYGEDLDLCYRMGVAGWQIDYLPAARVTHHGGEGGTNARFLRSVYYYHRAPWILLRRYPANRFFPLYGWLVVPLLVLRFAWSCCRASWNGRRVGTRKGSGVGRAWRPTGGMVAGGAGERRKS